jgi:hypothetical protein
MPGVRRCVFFFACFAVVFFFSIILSSFLPFVFLFSVSFSLLTLLTPTGSLMPAGGELVFVRLVVTESGLG